MQASEIPAHQGRVIGYRGGQIAPRSAYLLSAEVYGSQRDYGRGHMMYVRSKSRTTPQKAGGRLAWTFGWPVLTPNVATGSKLIEALRFLDECKLIPDEVFDQDHRGILTVRPEVFPLSLSLIIVFDPKKLIAPSGERLSGSAG